MCSDDTLCEEIIKTKAVYDQIASRYSKIWSNVKLMESRLERFINYLGKRSLSVLDAGCGTGRDVRYFRDKGVRATGIDISHCMLIEAKIICPEGRFSVMDMNNLAFNDNMFDGVWACASMIHLPRSYLCQTLREFHRVLKKPGILYLSMKQGVAEGYSDDGRFTAYYTDSMLSEALNAIGFEILHTDHNLAQKSTFSRSKRDQWINIWAKKRAN